MIAWGLDLANIKDWGCGHINEFGKGREDVYHMSEQCSSRSRSAIKYGSTLRLLVRNKV